MDTDIWRFLSACLAGEQPRHLFCATENMAEGDAGKANSLFVVLHDQAWRRYDATPDWSAIAMTAIRYPQQAQWLVLAMSSAGWVWTLHPRGPSEAFERIPRHVGLTNLATIGADVFACGMGRICFRRDERGTWTDLSAPWPPAEEGVIGFTGLGGNNAELFYAVGWQGEIWARVGDAWQMQDSPTNANLNAVAVAADGTAYCVGDDGAMVRGQPGAWDPVATDLESNLMDVCIHEGQVFVCSASEVLRLVAGHLINDFADDAEDLPRTCLRLMSDGAGHLYSVGPQDVFRRSDAGWERLA